MRSLPESRLYTFIDEPRAFALYFLEGQKLIHDLALIHPIQRGGFAYFRDTVLSVQPMIALLKAGEQFGFYVDSERPFFRLKIESGFHGATRCMLLPEEFHEFPPAMHGNVRVLKLFPDYMAPYESILEIDGLPLREIVNRVLAESYQVHSAILVSQQSDQSLMLHRLPPLPGESEAAHSIEAARSRRAEIRERAESLLAEALHDPQQIQQGFERLGFQLLASRPVVFRCSCSRERMISNLQPIHRSARQPLFDSGQPELEIVCEYCKARYRITRKELEHASDPLN